MGLFSKKEPCAICGGVVKGLFPWKIDGQYVCNDCYGVVDLPDNAVNHMTIEDFRNYMAFREENDKLRQVFQQTRKVDFGWLDTKFVFDEAKRLLCFDKNLNKTIFEGDQVKSFVIKEDSFPLFEGDASGLKRYQSTVPDRVMELAHQIDRMVAQAQFQESMERLADRLDDGKVNNSNNRNTYQSRIDIPEPFKNFNVEVRFEHPYWSEITADMSGPTFDDEFPDINGYLNEYESRVATMEELAIALMEIIAPGAPEWTVGADGTTAGNNMAAQTAAPAAAQSAPVDTVKEIQRFKELLDQGIITEEEFAAKKKQLLGI